MRRGKQSCLLLMKGMTVCLLMKGVTGCLFMKGITWCLSTTSGLKSQSTPLFVEIKIAFMAQIMSGSAASDVLDSLGLYTLQDISLRFLCRGPLLALADKLPN